MDSLETRFSPSSQPLSCQILKCSTNSDVWLNIVCHWVIEFCRDRYRAPAIYHSPDQSRIVDRLLLVSSGAGAGCARTETSCQINEINY